MKKLLAVLLAALMLGGLAVCANAEDTTTVAPEPTTTAAAEPTTTAAPEPTTTAAAEPTTTAAPEPTTTAVAPTTTAAEPTTAPAAATYTITYNDNGGSRGPAAQTKTEGVALTLSTKKPTRAGYTFKGWATSADGAVVYAPGGAYTADASATLYAVWEANGQRPIIQWVLLAPLYLVWFVVRTVLWILFGWLWMPFPAFGQW